MDGTNPFVDQKIFFFFYARTSKMYTYIDYIDRYLRIEYISYDLRTIKNQPKPTQKRCKMIQRIAAVISES